ncbi:MAG: response regulator [Burkholderiales bacterium]|jgi:DNA-binding NarL/FixJ family response regulator|nr:response regulator [Burkholderiales bacterium]
MSALRAFIVEDSPVILENLVGTLEELANVQVVGSAGDEAAAVRWMCMHAGEKADVFIVDVFLNSGTGLGVLRAAQQMGVAARRVVLTNYATDDMRRRCASLGAERVFDKSRQLEELINYCADLAGPPAQGLSSVPL